MFGNQIINLPVNTQYTYYFYLGNGVLNIGISNLNINEANDLQTNNPNTGATFQTGNSVISKNGASFVNTTNLPTELGNGWYSLVLTSSEMNFQDILLTIQTHNTDTNAHPWYTSIWLCTTSVGVSASNIATAVVGSTLSELTSIPTANDTLANKIQAIFQYLFFKRTVTASQEQLYKSDSSTVIGTGATLSDNGTTFTKGAES